MFSKSPKSVPKGKKTLKEIEAELEAKAESNDLDEVDGGPPSMSDGASTVPWKTVPADDIPMRYCRNVNTKT